MRFILSLALITLSVSASPAWAGELSKAAFNKLKKRIKVAALQGDEDTLGTLIAELAKDDSKRAVNLLLSTAMGLPKGKVFDATARALDAMTSDEVLEVLCARVGKKGGHPGVKILSIDTLASRSDKASGAALGKALSDKRPNVLRATMRAIRKRKAPEAVEGLFVLHERLKKMEKRRPDEYLQSEVEKALIEITGKYFEHIEDWRKYWKYNKGKKRPSTGNVKASLKSAERKKKKKPRFFGSEIFSSRVLFIIDVSGSMAGQRLQMMKDQLKKAIGGLSKKSRFTILAYSNALKTWNKNMQFASPANVEKAKSFVDGLKASGNTRTLYALQEGFKIKGPDTIILLSDGAPTGVDNKGQIIPTDKILTDVKGTNTIKKLKIDTFGFPGDTTLEKFMKDLAKQNGGKYTPVK